MLMVTAIAAAAAVLAVLTFWLFRRWHLRWGATALEVAAAMPGDDLVPRAHFVATRAIDIRALPDEVYPWLVQVGVGRAGFYSYDFLDNLGRRSATRILDEYQQVQVGDVAASMTRKPHTSTSFRVHGFVADQLLIWAKADASWVWSLQPMGVHHTRLVVRLRQRYDWRRPWAALPAIALLELADFVMMRRMLIGVRWRAEELAGHRRERIVSIR